MGETLINYFVPSLRDGRLPQVLTPAARFLDAEPGSSKSKGTD